MQKNGSTMFMEKYLLLPDCQQTISEAPADINLSDAEPIDNYWHSNTTYARNAVCH